MSRVHPQGFRIASTSHRLVQTTQKSWCGTFSPQRFQYRLCRPPTDAEAPTMLEITELPYAKAIEAQRAPGGWVFVAVALPLHSSAKWESGPISSMCANQHSNHLFSFGVCRVNPTFQMRAFLLHLIASYIIYLIASCCILLHHGGSWSGLFCRVESQIIAHCVRQLASACRTWPQPVPQWARPPIPTSGRNFCCWHLAHGIPQLSWKSDRWRHQPGR